MFKIIILVKLLIFFHLAQSNNINDKGITIKIENHKGSVIYKDVIEFIEDGRNYLSVNMQNNTKEKALMVLGLSGTGKSTLINYLNDIPLVCLKHKGKWVLDLESPNHTLPGGFSIGHQTKSETLYPSIYSPHDKEYSFIDNPGFRDTRGISIEIANGFFREQITHKINEMKFLLLITHQDLNNRGQQFRDSIKCFSDFMGIFDQNDENDNEKLNLFSKSIGIIITRVDNDGETDQTMREIFKEKLHEILNEEKESGNINENENKLFNKILNNNQIEIFSNPKKVGLVSNSQSIQIHDLINRMNYFNKDDAQLRVRIDQIYKSKLISYLKTKYEQFVSSLENKLSQSIEMYFIKYCNKIEHAQLLHEQLKSIQNLGMNKIKIESFLNELNRDLFCPREKQELITKVKILNYFIKLIPEMNSFFSFETFWISNQLKAKLIEFTSNITDHMSNEFNKFERKLENLLERKISSFYSQRLENAWFLNDLKIIEQIIFDLNYFSFNSVDFDSFIKSLVENGLLNDEEKQETIRNFNQFIYFIELKLRPFVKEWVGKKLSIKLAEILNELKLLHDDNGIASFDRTERVYFFKAHFANMSYIQSKINNDDITDIKKIKIYCSNSFVIDSDFKLDKEKYSANSPDLILIAPKIIITKNSTTIDLSCHSKPKFDVIRKRYISKRYYYEIESKDGKDGEPGLPGYNGGNLIIISNNIKNLDYLNFSSIGGQGGDGENGMDGENGEKGENGSEDCYFCRSSSEKFDREHDHSLLHYCFSYDNVYKKTIWGSEGRRGGDGGRPGIGGLPGYGGHVLSFDYSNKMLKYSKKEVNKNYGNGKAGRPGSPGLGGQYGDTLIKLENISNTYFVYDVLTLGLTAIKDTLMPSKTLTSYYKKNELFGRKGSVKNELNRENQLKPHFIQHVLLSKNNQKDYFDFLKNFIDSKFKRLNSFNQGFKRLFEFDLEFDLINKNSHLNSLSYDKSIYISKRNSNSKQSFSNELIAKDYDVNKFISMVRLSNGDLACAVLYNSSQNDIIIINNQTLEIKKNSILKLKNLNIIDSLFLLSNNDLACCFSDGSIQIYERESFDLKYDINSNNNYLVSFNDSFIWGNDVQTTKVLNEKSLPIDDKKLNQILKSNEFKLSNSEQFIHLMYANANLSLISKW